MNHPISENTCYVAHQGVADLFKLFGEKRVDLLFYPENGLTSMDRRIGIKYIKSIVTESAQMICMYDAKDVFIWRNGEWVNPDRQTYGCSYEIIESDLLKFRNSISTRIVGGVEELREKIKNLYN